MAVAHLRLQLGIHYLKFYETSTHRSDHRSERIIAPGDKTISKNKIFDPSTVSWKWLKGSWLTTFFRQWETYKPKHSRHVLRKKTHIYKTITFVVYSDPKVNVCKLTQNFAMLFVCRLTLLLSLLCWRSWQVSSWASGRISWAHRGWIGISLELQPRRQLWRTVGKEMTKISARCYIKTKCCTWSLICLMTCCCTLVSGGKSLWTCISSAIKNNFQVLKVKVLETILYFYSITFHREILYCSTIISDSQKE